MTLASQDTTRDTHLKDFLRQASRAIDNYCRRRFYPEQRTLFYDLPRGRDLTFDHDVLEVRGLSHINGASEIDSSVYWLKSGDDWNRTPYDRVQLDRSSGSVFNFSGTPQRAVHVSAVIGYHEDYDNAWVDSGASLTDAITATVTALSVSGSGGENRIGFSPRFQTEQIVKIDNEFIHIASGNGSILTVNRGINGTTAASHAASTTVFTWRVEEDIEASTRELVRFRFIQSTANKQGTLVIPSFGGFSLDVPESWPNSTLERLRRYRKQSVYNI